MRQRVANPLLEAHGQAMTVIEWIAAAGQDPVTVHTRVEGAVALAALKLYHRGDGQVTGSVTTLPCPASPALRYVCVALHRVACSNVACHTGHRELPVPVQVAVAPALPANALALIGAAVGEDPANVLTGGAGDTAILTGLGFRPPDATTGFPGDAPFRT